MSLRYFLINHGTLSFLYDISECDNIQSVISLPPVYLPARQTLYILWHHINTVRGHSLIKRSIKLTLSPAACFSACAAHWGLRAAGSDTRSRLWWGTLSHRCNRNPAPGGPLHLEEGRRHVCHDCNVSNR